MSYLSDISIIKTPTDGVVQIVPAQWANGLRPRKLKMNTEKNKDELIKELYSNIQQLQAMCIGYDKLLQENCVLVQENRDMQTEIINLKKHRTLQKMDIICLTV